MIPKIIHYCWFGDKKMPAAAKRCIESWRRFCPEYELREWNESNFDFSENRYAQQAYEHKKWAFVTDYVRMAVLVRYGGIYLDTDVEIIRSFDPLLECDGFCGVEGEFIASGLALGAIPDHPVILALEKFYGTQDFLDADGKPDLTSSANLQAPVLEQLGFDRKRAGVIQRFSGMTVYPAEYFCPKSFRDGTLRLTPNTFSIHHYSASWASPASRIGYHLRRLAGERVYVLCRTFFKKEDVIGAGLLFAIIFLQNLRGILHGIGLNISIFGLLLILLVGSMYAYGIWLRRRPSRESLWLLAGAIIAVATPGNATVLWALCLALLCSQFSFSQFALFNVLSMLLLLSGVMAALGCGWLTGEYGIVKKVHWDYFYNFGFTNSNLFSLFLYQTIVYAYWFLRRDGWWVAGLLPLAMLCYLCSGGRTYSCAIGIIAIVHFLPEVLRRIAAKLLLPGAIFLGGAAFVLGWLQLDWHWLRAAINQRVVFWHVYVNDSNTIYEILFGRLVRQLPESMPPLDSGYLSVYVTAGAIGVAVYIAMFATVIRRNRKMVLMLTPVFVSMLFAAFFESHLFGASMLALFPLYFVFNEKQS